MTVEARNVTVRRGGRNLLDDVSMNAPAGSVTGLIGPNGAGKTTLLSVLSGDIAPDSGSVLLNGHAPAGLSDKELAQTRSVMLQNPTMAFSFLVRDVVEMARMAWTGTEQAQFDEDIVDDALAVAGVVNLQDRDILTLSGGERARASLARLLAQRASIAFLDEPTAAMDVAHQEQTMEIARQLARSGVTVIVVLHDLQAAASYCDNIVCLKSGAVLAAGPVAKVCTSDTLSTAYDWPIHVQETEKGISILPERGAAMSHGGTWVLSARDPL